ncbi:MAG: GyrI-like domain-containing protein [Negativibacillus massiliensis]|uniref:GyrI-like domain-containing protein n=1 Tax=Negativibacillus massiliensis TaxID=1871035 RepID=UPI0039A25CAE
MDKVIKKAFVVIGKEGSTLDGEGFIQKLWDDANGHFTEVAHLAKRDENGNLVGIWGAMSDLSHSFQPWEDGFSKGLYLAGVECVDNAEAPDGWTKWMIPGYEYLVVENHDGAFGDTIRQMNDKGIALVGAVHDYTDPATGKGYLYFPIKEVK